MLSLKSILPTLPMITALSANHLAALDLPPNLRRLYVARDNDDAGPLAAVRLRDRAAGAELEMFELRPVFADFNVDLCQLGAATLLRHLVPQLVPADRVRFAQDVSEADAREATSWKPHHDCRRRRGPGKGVWRRRILPTARAQGGLPERAICQRRRAAAPP
jgi:hypothetical protein